MPDGAAPSSSASKGLKRYFDVSAPWLVRTLEGRPRQIVQAVDGIDIEIAKGETFSLVGEFGLRQVDGGAPRGRALSADRRLASSSTATTWRAATAAPTWRRCAGACR